MDDKEEERMSTGTTVQVIGAVVDVQFPAGENPKGYDALILDKIPNESHDVPMDIVVAETAIYRGEEP